MINILACFSQEWEITEDISDKRMLLILSDGKEIL
jgi:hypothetical protein